MYQKYINKVKKTISKNSSSTNKKNPKTRLSNAVKFSLFCFFAVGILISFFTCKFICRNDCFEINGKKSISISVGDTYEDEGVTAIGFGKDLSEKINIEIYKDSTKLDQNVDIDTSQEAVYQIIYTVSSFRFKDVKLIRVVSIIQPEIVDPEEDVV